MLRTIMGMTGSLLLLVSQAAFAQSVNWTISESSGTVLVKTATAAAPAKKGGQVPPGAVISTGAGARAVLVHGKDFVTVNANGRVRIPAAGDEGFGLFDVLQEWGNAVFQIEKQPKPHFTVRTRYLAAVVKGTTFSITVSDQGASLQVVEGAVETSTADGGARELVTPGVVAMVEAADRFRLTVQDRQTRTIDSPARTGSPMRNDNAGGAAGPASEPAAPASNSQPETAVPAEPSAEPSVAALISPTTIGSFDSEPQVLTEAITAVPTNVDATTDGFVSGALVAEVASADVSAVRGQFGVNGSQNENYGDSGKSGDNGSSDNSGKSGDNGNSGKSGDNGRSGDNGNRGRSF